MNFNEFLNESSLKPMGLSKDETKKVAETYAKAISKLDGGKCTVNMRTLEEDSFDLDFNGEEFDGGSYSIDSNGNVYNNAMGVGMKTPPIYGKWNDSVDAIIKNIKKLSESVVNETGFKASDMNKTIDFINKEIGTDPGYALIGDEEDIEEFNKLWNAKEYKDAFDVLVVATNMDISTFADVKNALKESKVNEGKGFKNTEDFEAFLEEIDGMPESAIKKIMGKDYIDTPGGYADEAEDYDNDIIEYMISNMGRSEFEKLQDYWESNVAESVVNERNITIKRQYTENHPAVVVGKAAKIRNKVLEAIKDGKISQVEFDNLLKEMTTDSKRWLKRNTQYFNVSEDGISLSKSGKAILKNVMVSEATTKNPKIWVPGGFEKQISKYPNNKITRKIVLDAAVKWEVAPEDAISYVEYGWAIDLDENKKTEDMKTKFIYESFAEFVENKLNEGTLNEAFGSAKLASLLTGGNSMPKDLASAFYNMSKLALDKIQDVDIIEMDPQTAKKEKRASAVYFYFTTNEKENPYTKDNWTRKIPANTLLAITDGSNEWMNAEWSRYGNKGKILKTTKRDDSAGISKSSANASYGSGISSMKQVADLADRAYCLDLDILKARYSTEVIKLERGAAKRGATAFQSDKDFKAENKARYNAILAQKASELPIDKVVLDAIEELSNQIKDALAKGEKGKYNELIMGHDPKGREVKLSDASNLMRNILDDYQRFVGEVAQSEKEKAAGYGGTYYDSSLKQRSKNIIDNVKKIENKNYAW